MMWQFVRLLNGFLPYQAISDDFGRLQARLVLSVFTVSQMCRSIVTAFALLPFSCEIQAVSRFFSALDRKRSINTF